VRRPILVPVGIAAVIVLLLVAAAATHPVVRPLVERFVVLTVAAGIVIGLVMAVARAHPEAASTDLDPARVTLPEPGVLPIELRRVAGTFERPVGLGSWRGQNVGGRALIYRMGRERLSARGLDVDDPAHAPHVQPLVGEHLWVLVTTPLDQPVRHVDVDAALDRLEAL
jgi:hypothetical protein